MASFYVVLCVLALCPFCSCCYADIDTQVVTCSKPNSLNSYNGEASCPNPPAISINAQFPFGRLEGYDVYVAEHLLNISNDITAAVLHQRFVGGFVLHPPNPAYSTCGCQSREESCQILTPALTASNVSSMDCCSLFANLSAIAPCTDSTQWSETYNGLSDDCLDFTLCSDEPQFAAPPMNVYPNTSTFPEQCMYPNCTERLVGKVSPPSPTTNKTAVTIWFNNQVTGEIVFQFISGLVDLWNDLLYTKYNL